MASNRTVDLLPEIFRTETNTKFLKATLDQMVQEPDLVRTQGFVGRRSGTGVQSNDNYVVEITDDRVNYQLEPGVVFLDSDTSTVRDLLTYPGFSDALEVAGAKVNRQDRLYSADYYVWDPFVDLDKFTNYSQYYWLPGGPDSVDVSGTDLPLTDAWEITRSNNGYEFSDLGSVNPIITLVRGGNYTFSVNQTGFNFWIQADPGVDGTMAYADNISSRDVLGVENNGEDAGTITFRVPLSTAQDFFYTMDSVGNVDLVTELNFNEINNVYVDTFLEQYPSGIDGITDLDGRTVVFSNTIFDTQDGGWQITSQFDPLTRTSAVTDPDPLDGFPGSFDTIPYDQTVDITNQDQRYSVWQIRYVSDDDGNQYIQLVDIRTVPKLSKFNVNFGTTNSSTQWYKNTSGYFERMPLLTATLDTLYYQDADNANAFGIIRIVDEENRTLLDVNDIVGSTTYTSPTGVVFSNGMKVQFLGRVNPGAFQDQEFYVEGVGTGPGILQRVGFVDGEAYFGPFHVHQSRKMTGAVHTVDVYHQYIYDTVQESLDNIGAGGPAGSLLPSNGTFDDNIGTGIKLIPVDSFVTPETYTRSNSVPYDSTPYDAVPYDDNLNSPLDPDYITVNRSSRDRNAWSRSNRWFHIDLLSAVAGYNNQVLSVDNSFRAKRPIVEFRPNLKFYNFGTQSKGVVDVIDFAESDVLSNIRGSLGYSIDGYTLIDGSKIIFAADLDSQVRNKIYTVKLIDTDGSGSKVIDLVPADNSTTLIDQTVVVTSGQTQQGKSFWFNGTTWQSAQEKISINQAPLFDVFDQQGVSIGNNDKYPSTSFRGSRLFGYTQGSGTNVDPVLGFPLVYQSLTNVGDISFTNYFYTDIFTFVRDGVGQQTPVSVGFVREYNDRTSFKKQIGWQTAAQKTQSRQIFTFDYDTGTDFVLDVAIDNSTVFAPVLISVDGEFVNPDDYIVTVNNTQTTITLLNAYTAGAQVEIKVYSRQSSNVAYYEVPSNLEDNPFNENNNQITLGTIRGHYETIGQNLRTLSGAVVGANNSRDLGNILTYGSLLIQHSSPLALTGAFLRDENFNILSALDFNSRHYVDFKSRMLDQVTKGDYVNMSAADILDDVISILSLERSEVNPFYWADMLPSGQNYIENIYTYSAVSTSIFDTVQSYDFNSSNFQGLLVYVNDNLLTKGYDYSVSDDSPTIEITAALAVGDRIRIREYTSTAGSFVPNTPTKMGLYSAYRPESVNDTSYLTPRQVIIGHDGSKTVAFEDLRDQVLLEYETRVYNNLKIQSPVPIVVSDVTPGQFRTTDYSLNEINNILSRDFLNWVGRNSLDYITQTYQADDSFTYNYRGSQSRLDDQTLAGFWRGIYQYMYDTDRPDTRPWEMLGFSEIPAWWTTQYGPAPYTSGNAVLWDDLEEGIIRDPFNTRVDSRYTRPGLGRILPVDSSGNLLSPIDAVVGNFDTSSFRRSWVFGDGGPAESAWRTSSAWPFAAMRLLALTKPAEFFSLFADRDRYVYDTQLGQYLWDKRYRLDAKQLSPMYGNGVSKASYVNWIIDYNRQKGLDSTQDLSRALASLDVRLCWRTAAFTDKNYLKIFTDRSNPDTLNTSQVLPDESYQLLLYKNQPSDRVTYSSVIVQRTRNGYSVFGYNQQAQFFEILRSRLGAGTRQLTVGNIVESVPLEHDADQIDQVPYGFVYTSIGAVCDFLVSYGARLEQQGLIFESRENGYVLDWYQMAREFLYWSQQGWAEGSILNLNPGATSISVERQFSVVDNILAPDAENVLLNQNRQPLSSTDLVIDRNDNRFMVRSVTQNTINFVNLKFTSYEHVVVLDNRSVFSDLIYQPSTGSRQTRLLISGWLTGNWTGTLNAPGFVLNQDNIKEWRPNRKYSKGEIVLFKDQYWTASRLIQPAAEFEFSAWIKSDYADVQKGLLPNAATQSTQLAQAYSVYNTNLEQEKDLFSYGLIGFRPRQYMSSLNLDDVSQVNLYRQFISEKGTKRSLELFSLADLGKETAEYNISEYWAVLRNYYGATANRNYVEFLLNRSSLLSDPGIIQVTLPQQTTLADQNVLLNDIWRSSRKYNSPDIFPLQKDIKTDRALPSAGYANFNDADIVAFDFDEFENNNELISQIGIGTTVWIAKTNSYDWNIYRAEQVPGKIISITDNLNNKGLVRFTQDHGLSIDDILVIKFFDPAVNGIYRVLATPAINTVIVDYEFIGDQSIVTGDGVGLTLETARVAQAADIANVSYAKQLLPGVKFWVDNNGSNRWTVLEKTDPFDSVREFSPDDVVENSGYGTAVAQGFQNLSALVGSPGYNPDSLSTAPGSVYTYVKNDQDSYEQNSILELLTTDAAGYGNAIDMGRQNWALIGASASASDAGYGTVIFRDPGSSVFQQWQLLYIEPGQAATAADEFGYSVSVSLDERWMFVGAPGGNRVYAYSRVDKELQSVEYTNVPGQDRFNYSNHIVVDSGDQLSVVKNNQVLVFGSDYITTANEVVFTVPFSADDRVVIARRSSKSFLGDGSTATYDLSDINGAVSESAVVVYINNVLQRPTTDYTVNGSQILTFSSAPGTTDQVEIRVATYFSQVAVLTVNNSAAADRFGHAVKTSTNGRKVIVGAPGVDSAETDQGAVYVFDRAVENFQVSDLSTVEFTTTESISLPTRVRLNGQELKNSAEVPNGDYTVSGNTVSITAALAIGDILSIDINQFSLEQTIYSNTPGNGNQFGYALDHCINDCSLYIGAPFSDNDQILSGKVEYNINQSVLYGISVTDIANPTLTVGNTIRINNFYVESTGTTVSQLVDDINAAAIPNTKAELTQDGKIVFSVINADTVGPFASLSINPGTGTLFTDLGITSYVYQQTIESPVVQARSEFGKTVHIASDAQTLLIAAPRATAVTATLFDNNSTTFDAVSTVFNDTVDQSGVVYSFDRLAAVNESITNSAQFVFGQQIISTTTNPLDQFGTSIDFTTGTLLIGAPGTDLDDSQANYGSVLSLRNLDQRPAWQTTRTQQLAVDTDLLNRTFIYDRVTNLPTRYFDFFDPLQGRVLGVVEQNINYKSAVDPAQYNVGDLNNYGNTWQHSRLGDIWWDTSDVRFVDVNQDDIVYASRRWGQVFPGSSVDIYQWIESEFPPGEYIGPGTAKSQENYVVSTALNDQGVFVTRYYFWVSGIDTVNTAAGKTLSAETLRRYIENPRSSGVSFIAVLNSSTLAIYNSLGFIEADDTVLHVEFDRIKNDAAVHSEYQLIPEDRGEGFLTPELYLKLQDSFSGVDQVGRSVPDPFLGVSERYGIAARPRQTMFVDRLSALQNYLTRVNRVLENYPISETRRFTLLNSQEPEPPPLSKAWDKRVNNREELTFQNLVLVPVGYRYLVASDSEYRGIWSIYEVVEGRRPGDKQLTLTRVQNYNTQLYWTRRNWYRPGYDPATRITTEVANVSELDTLVVPDGSSVRVAANGQGLFEIYQLQGNEWLRVALENGTIEFNSTLWDYAAGRYGFDLEVFDSQFFDQEPVIETRRIIQAINEELLIDDLSIERNRALVLMFNYVLSEQKAPEWIMKTSLIDVAHTIRQLTPFQSYRLDNQDFVLDYINEVKPYRTQIREFSLIYEGNDIYQGSATDFDVPAQWDSSQGRFISPVLDDTGTLSSTSSVPDTAAIWSAFPWNQWFNNYKLNIESIAIVDSGSGYTTAPEVVVTGAAVVTAVLAARINSAGVVVAVDIVTPGSGYTDTPEIQLIGDNGTGAKAIAVMSPGVVRDINTVIKYDRYQYNTAVTEWTSDITYASGDLVRFNNQVWRADNNNTQSTAFDPIDWTVVPAAELSGVDRTMGYYNPTVDQPGLDLALLISGVDYPGVQVDAPDFNANTGFDVGNFDINPYDNISFGPEGRPTYDTSILDTIYESEFSDSFLGQRATDINVDGGGFVDTYSSHAPEELVPGAIFDTLDLRVFTSPGADWPGEGHGFPVKSQRYVYESSVGAYSYSSLIKYPVGIRVWNQSRGQRLLEQIDYTVDYVSETFTIINNVSDNEIVIVNAYGVGSGNQLYRNSYLGQDVENTVVIPLEVALIENIILFVNDTPVAGSSFAAEDVGTTRVTFPATYGTGDSIVLIAFGADNGQVREWSSPVTEQFTADGSTQAFTLTNDLSGTNPANVWVEKNGIRARPAEGIEYVSDGISTVYLLPDRGGYTQNLVADNDVDVYVDTVPLTLGVDFVVTPWDGSSDRSVILTDTPGNNAKILISVRTAAQYYITGTTLIWKSTGTLALDPGDTVTVTTWNDTSEQDILTQVFQGPETSGVELSDGYDETAFDLANINDDPGSFDYAEGIVVRENRFDTGRNIDSTTRLIVTLDGKYLFDNLDYTVDGTEIVIPGSPVNSAQVIAITSFTQRSVPGEIAFRVFQDMRGNQTVYRISESSTTVLTQPLTTIDDVISVSDAGMLAEPSLEAGIFGIITVGSERITYRTRDTDANTVSGLRRGTAGTAATDHTAGADVYSIGVGEQIPEQYQNYVESQHFLADGSTRLFVADNIENINLTGGVELEDVVEVYVGGIKQMTDYVIDGTDPVAIEFVDAPTANYQVTILVRRGQIMYAQGTGTASDGVPLQEQDTMAARFIRGL